MKKVKIGKVGNNGISFKEGTACALENKVEVNSKDDFESSEQPFHSFFSPACSLSEFDPEKDTEKSK